MSDDPKKPKQELLPPQRRSTEVARPAHPKPTGVIGSVTSGFVARVQSRSIDAHTERHKSTLAYINVDTEIAAALKANFITWGELYDIDNILDEQQRGREVGRLMARIRDASELERLEKEAEIQTEELDERLIRARARRWQLEREITFAQQATASLDVQEQTRNRVAEERARIDLIIQETRRTTLERIRDLSVKTGLHQASEKEAKAHENALDAEFARAAALDAMDKTRGRSTPQPTNSFDAVIAVLEDQIDLAKQRSAPRETLDTLYTLLGRYLAERDAGATT